MTPHETYLQDRLDQYNFYHFIRLTENVQTKGIAEYVPTQQGVLAAIKRLDLKGHRVLDIGCRDGLYSFEAEKAGASEIIGIDNCISNAAVEVLIPELNSKVQMHEQNLFDLTERTYGKFDTIIFAGVLYHLRYPFWALKLLRDLLSDRGQMILETGVMLNDNQYPLLFCPTEDESPYEATSVTFFNPKALRDTLATLGLQVTHIELLNHPDLLEREPTLGLKDRVKRFLGRTPDRIIDRLTLTCRVGEPTSSSETRQYWDGTHELE
ncbi:SAM-dependent methyltransferase [Rhodopirellula rubra]|uniref:SAM-dependent methyltransferase n=1 Tax=Aporhodopirellula rubra TaxID=980271 RepID=A0A7W5DU92_9BACT|nr:methyltransferase domain-containing protein [Aporhodopirellula rubra]MBB3204274.1 SAM-dependent methyltransferase [Aporhodopirellula rubra]